jgi:hypothetical protein
VADSHKVADGVRWCEEGSDQLPYLVRLTFRDWQHLEQSLATQDIVGHPQGSGLGLPLAATTATTAAANTVATTPATATSG